MPNFDDVHIPSWHDLLTFHLKMKVNRRETTGIFRQQDFRDEETMMPCCDML